MLWLNVVEQSKFCSSRNPGFYISSAQGGGEGGGERRKQGEEPEGGEEAEENEQEEEIEEKEKEVDEGRKRRRRTSSKRKRGTGSEVQCNLTQQWNSWLMGQDNCFFPVDKEKEKEEEEEVEEEKREEKITVAVQSGPDVELRPGLHQGDQMETGDVTEKKLGCLQEGSNGEVSCSRACMGESQPDPLQCWTMAEDRSCW